VDCEGCALQGHLQCHFNGRDLLRFFGIAFPPIIGLVLIVGYPLAFLIAGAEWLLLGAFAITIGAMAVLIGLLMCAHCINFSCPLNHVDRSVREAFFARNPLIRRAWKIDKMNDE
jgi:hypothetical protein